MVSIAVAAAGGAEEGGKKRARGVREGGARAVGERAREGEREPRAALAPSAASVQSSPRTHGLPDFDLLRHFLLLYKMPETSDDTGHYIDGLADLIECHQDGLVIVAIVLNIVLVVLVVVHVVHLAVDLLVDLSIGLSTDLSIGLTDFATDNGAACGIASTWLSAQ
jgi:hypothetical protein